MGSFSTREHLIIFVLRLHPERGAECPAVGVGPLLKSAFICILIIHGCALTHRQEGTGGVLTHFCESFSPYLSLAVSFSFAGPGALWDVW